MSSFGAVLLLVGFRLLGDKDKVPLRWAISPVGLHFDFGDSERAFPFSSLRSFAWKVKFRYGPSAIITGVDGTSTLVPRISVFALEEMDSAVRRRRPVSEAEVEADNPP